MNMLMGYNPHVRLAARLSIGHTGISPVTHVHQLVPPEAEARTRDLRAVVRIELIADAGERKLPFA